LIRLESVTAPLFLAEVILLVEPSRPLPRSELRWPRVVYFGWRLIQSAKTDVEVFVVRGGGTIEDSGGLDLDRKNTLICEDPKIPRTGFDQ